MTQKPGSDTQLSVQELLKPRYKVIADYPNSRYDVGEIIDETNWTDPHIEWIEFLNQYPHLFKKLQWWEERPINELPKYLKTRHQGVLTIVIEYPKYGYVTIPDKYFGNINGTFTHQLFNFFPATREEYDNQHPAS